MKEHPLSTTVFLCVETASTAWSVCMTDWKYLSYLFEGVGLHVGEYIALGHREDLEGHSTVMVLQWRDVIIAHGQLSTSINLIPGYRGQIFEQFLYCIHSRYTGKLLHMIPQSVLSEVLFSERVHVSDIRVVVSRVVQVMTHACSHQNALVCHSQPLLRKQKQVACWSDKRTQAPSQKDMTSPEGYTDGSFHTSSGSRKSSGGSCGKGCRGSFLELQARDITGES